MTKKRWPLGKQLAAVLGLCAAGALLFYALSGPAGGKPGAKERKPAPEISLPDVNGRTRTLSEFRGKIVLLDFWATWCEPCLEEIPDLIRFHDAHKDQNFTIVGVAMDAEGVSVVGPFVRQNKMPYPILISGGDLPAGYNVLGFPSAFLIDKDGNIARTYLGPKSYEELERDVSELSSGR
jgi:thiol-disulfide isomerase/thioredoxin